MAFSSAQTLSAFLGQFPTPLHYKNLHTSMIPLWIFWSKDEEGSQINLSSSADLHPPVPTYNIISAFFGIQDVYTWKYIVQLWAPVTIGGRRLLCTSAQPFSFTDIAGDDLKKYRLRSMKYYFNIDDVNNQQQLHIQQQEEENDEGYPRILSGGPAAAFLNRMAEFVCLMDHQQGSPLARYALECGLRASVMLPICYPASQTSSCIGVLEYTAVHTCNVMFLRRIKRVVERSGLSVCHVQERIPYKTINALKPTRDEIEAALKIICVSHKLSLAQVWIPYVEENHVPFSSSSEDTQMKRKIALKLTDHVNKDLGDLYEDVESYRDMFDVICLKEGNELVEMTLQDYKPRLYQDISNLSDNMLMAHVRIEFFQTSAVAICLRSIDTGDLDYAFEFICQRTSNNDIFLEALLFTLKMCLPRFKFASGTEIGDELEIYVIDDPQDIDDELTGELKSQGGAKNVIDREIKSFKVFQGKKSSPLAIALKTGKEPMVVDSSQVTWKTAPKELPRELVEEQFGNTMKKAAENLNVSLSTLRRKCKELEISEWQGPNFLKKRKGNDSSNRNEEDDGAIQEPYIVNKNENTLTIKAKYADDTIKFKLHMSEVTFVNVEKEIGVNFNLSLGNYKLNYLDEDEDWILLRSDKDMSYCLESLRKLGQHVVRLRVIQSTQ